MDFDLRTPESAGNTTQPLPPIAPPLTAPTANTVGNRPHLFGPYACHLPTFDLDKLAGGLYERDPRLSPPENGDVDVVAADPETYVKLIQQAITRKPERLSEYEKYMCVTFVNSMMRISDRDTLITQIAAEVVRSVNKLHEPSDQGESMADGSVEGEDGAMIDECVDMAKQPDVIGDHLHADQIEGIGPDPRDLNLTATARLDAICNVLLQTKDADVHLVAAPYRKQADKYRAQQQQQQYSRSSHRRRTRYRLFLPGTSTPVEKVLPQRDDACPTALRK